MEDTWLERVLPNIIAITSAHPEGTLFTRFIRAEKPRDERVKLGDHLDHVRFISFCRKKRVTGSRSVKNGSTSFLRALGQGFWQSGGGTEKDSIAVAEVMVEHLDHAFWRSLRQRLERELAQDEIVIRAQDIARF
jgi:hypothetical protein